VTNPRVERVVRRVWGHHAEAALAVARCESGRRGTRAANGQFRGLFQMGRWARRKYGHGRCAEAQARAAQRYFLEAGWKPWGCKPWRARGAR